MDYSRTRGRLHISVNTVINFGDYGSCAIDQSPAQSFNIDPATGVPMSDITCVLRAQGLEQQRLLSDLTEFKAQYLPDDISDADALKYYKPRLCQMPSELAEYQENLIKQKLEEQEKEKKEKLFKDLFDKSDPDVDKDDKEVKNKDSESK